MTDNWLWHARRENWSPGGSDARGAADVDYGRVVHSASFRRLQGKTQILNLGDSDFYRTRLTHSMEVAQIAGGITRQLRSALADHPAVPYLPDLSMIQAIGFSHDLGHPPFGHGGEVALNYCMRPSDSLDDVAAAGFEGNGQTLRILARLEKFSAGAGANLSRRTLLGVLKYPIPFSRGLADGPRPALAAAGAGVPMIDRAASKPPKCYLDGEQEVVDWILEPLSESDRALFTLARTVPGKHAKAMHKSFDCSIMDLADDISFGIHDLEDAVALDLIGEDDFRAHVREEDCAAYLDYLKARYPDESQNDVYESFVRMLFGDGRARKHAINRMVGYLITHCGIDTVEPLQEPLIRYRAAMQPGPAAFLAALQRIVRDLVILSPAVQHLEFKGQHMVVSVFEVFASDPKAFLPRDTYAAYVASDTPRRVLCDHIAGMTDSFLLRTYERLFSPRMGSVFDRH